MQKLLLMIVVLFGLSIAAPAQGAPVPSSKSDSTVLAVAPAQPIAFNHKLHVQTAKMTCNDCHQPRGNGSTLAMPQPPKCMTCHSSIATESPDIRRIAAAAKNEDPISWVRVYRVPSFVTFSHKTHTAAGSTCEDCHGPVAERTSIALEKDTSMGTCIACHQAKQAPTTCDTCHAIMSKNGRNPVDVDAALLARLQLAAAKPATVASVSHAPVYGMPENALHSSTGSSIGPTTRPRVIQVEERMENGPHRPTAARGGRRGKGLRRAQSNSPQNIRDRHLRVADWWRESVPSPA